MKTKPERPSREELAKLVKQGLTRQQIADHLGLSYFRAVHFLKTYGLKPVRGNWGEKRGLVKRDAAIMKQIAIGMALTAIAKENRLSTHRIYQIAEKNGMTRPEVRRAMGK